MRRRLTVRTGLEAFGPLYETPPADGGAPTGDPAPADKGAGDKGAGAGGAPPAPSGDMIPKARFDEILSERNALAKEKSDRETKEAKDRGEHEKVAAAEKERADKAETKAESYARKLAFVTSATGKVSDVSAAHKLAQADGLLSSIELDDEGNPKDAKALDTIIDGLVKTYEFLKPGKGTGRSFGGDHGGQDPTAGLDPEKLSSQEKMELGIRQAGARS